MKTKREKALLLIFLGLTVALGSVLSYTMYLYIGVAALFRSLDENLTIDKIEIYAYDSSELMKITMTVYNSFAGSYLKLYAAVKELYIGDKVITLYSGGEPFAGTFTNVDIPPLHNATVTLAFDVSSYSLNTQDLQNLKIKIRLQPTSVINEDVSQRLTYDLIKSYAGSH
jgi:hypothetical protein